MRAVKLTGADLIITFPLAYFSDHHGRRVVLLLNTAGLALMWSAILLVGLLNGDISITFMAFAPIFTLLGGGDCVFISTVAAAITDIAPDERTRATLFSYTSSMAYVSTLCAPALAAFTMTHHLWLPFYIGLALLVLAMPMAFVLPKQPERKEEASENDEGASLLAAEHRTASGSQQETKGGQTRQIGRHIRSLAHSVYSRPKFQLLLAVFFLASLASSNTPILVLYISKRYHWTIAQAGYLLSAKAAVNVFLFTILIPSLVHLALHRCNVSPHSIHVGAAEISIFISVLGALMVAVAFDSPTLIAGMYLGCTRGQ